MTRSWAHSKSPKLAQKLEMGMEVDVDVDVNVRLSDNFGAFQKYKCFIVIAVIGLFGLTLNQSENGIYIFN